HRAHSIRFGIVSVAEPEDVFSCQFVEEDDSNGCSTGYGKRAHRKKPELPAEAKIIVPVDATVFELKRTISIATDVSPEQQILLFKDRELKDNTATLDQYGIVSACTLTMNVKMHTGILVDQFTRRSKNKSNSPNLPTPAKQKEHEKTRKRMKVES
ncbi:ubiquitin family protein, partial [Teladorsagia circumcincta]